MGGWFPALVDPGKRVFSQISQFLMGILLVVIILIIGWVIGKVIKTLVTKFLRTAKLDELSARIDLDSILAKGGIKYSLSELLGVICYWITILITLVIAVNAVGLTVSADLLNKIVLYVPNIIAAIIILILGMFVATLLKNIVQTATMNAGLSQANMLGRATEVGAVIFAIVIALEQLGIGTKIIDSTVTIVLGSVGLAIALAFGLGCRDMAAKFMSELIEKLKKK